MAHRAAREWQLAAVFGDAGIGDVVVRDSARPSILARASGSTGGATMPCSDGGLKKLPCSRAGTLKGSPPPANASTDRLLHPDH